MNGLKELVYTSCYFLSIKTDVAQIYALNPDVKTVRKLTAKQDWILGSIKTWVSVSVCIFLNYFFFYLWAILAAVCLGNKRDSIKFR